MKNILCFGDSLTWGFDPETFTRFPYNKRWTGILQEQLGLNYRVIEEGLNGRTSVFNDAFTPFLEYGVGANTLPMLLDSHAPLDLVIIMLGTNDLQPHRNTDVKQAARGCGKCIEQVIKSTSGLDFGTPKVLLIAPPACKQPQKIMEIAFSDQGFDQGKLAHYDKTVADTFGVGFLDSGKYVEASDADGIHLDEKANVILANKISEKVQEILT